MGSFQQYYEIGPLKNYSSSTIAWIPSLQIFFLFALGPIVGIVHDNYGPRPLIIGGTILHVFGLMMASLAKTYYQFILSQGVCSAIGVACIYTPGMSHLFLLFECSLLTEISAMKHLPVSQPGFPRSVEPLWAS